MPPKYIHVIGGDGGGTTGWARLTIPRLCVFGDEDPDIHEWDYGELNGAEPAQAIELARYVRETQSLDYKVGPALVMEAWDIDPTFKSTDQDTYSPVRINAMMILLKHQGLLGDASLTFQRRGQAFQAYTDDRLKKLGMYVPGSDHIRAATKHAMTAIRRARENPDFAIKLWPNLVFEEDEYDE